MDRRLFFFVVAILALAGGALGFRLPQLDRRPMHCDEANQAYRAGLLLETGEYKYDPWDGHGPSLYWLTLPLLHLSGAEDLAGTGEFACRLLPVLFGAGLVLLLPLVSDGLGRRASLVAGLLTAISPALVFYSRYYIQEMLLVFFTFATIASAWRYVRSRRLGWAAASGLCLGMMFATKETWILAAFAMTVAMGLTLFWGWWVDGTAVQFRHYLRLAPVMIAVGTGTLAATALYSSFGTNWQGVSDSITAYATHLHRGGGGGDHAHPWYYYFQLLVAYRPQRGFFWTEGLIVALAMIGGAASLLPRSFRTSSLGGGDRSFQRFLTFYTLVLTALYCAISYKTPWCCLGFLHGMVLLAGVGACALLGVISLPSSSDADGVLADAKSPPRRLRQKIGVVFYRLLVGALLIAAACHLGRQAHTINFRYCADERNPWVYVHTSNNILDFARMMESLARVSPQGRGMVIHMVSPEVWPLPWYLRQFNRNHVGHWQDWHAWARETAADPPPSVLLVDPEFEEEIQKHLRADYRQGMYYGLRPRVKLAFYVRADLWHAFVQAQSE